MLFSFVGKTLKIRGKLVSSNEKKGPQSILLTNRFQTIPRETLRARTTFDAFLSNDILVYRVLLGFTELCSVFFGYS